MNESINESHEGPEVSLHSKSSFTFPLFIFCLRVVCLFTPNMVTWQFMCVFLFKITDLFWISSNESPVARVPVVENHLQWKLLRMNTLRILTTTYTRWMLGTPMCSCRISLYRWFQSLLDHLLLVGTDSSMC